MIIFSDVPQSSLTKSLRNHSEEDKLLKTDVQQQRPMHSIYSPPWPYSAVQGNAVRGGGGGEGTVHLP